MNKGSSPGLTEVTGTWMLVNGWTTTGAAAGCVGVTLAVRSCSTTADLSWLSDCLTGATGGILCK